MTPRVPKDLLKVDPKQKSLYDRFSLPRLTAYSVHWLSVWGIPVTYENVSVLNARLFPTEFAMRDFSEFPDANRTNRTILQMRPKYRGFATSDPRKGVFLTERGKQEAIIVTQSLGAPTFEGKQAELPPGQIDFRRPTKSKERTRNPAQIIEDLRSRLLFRRYKEGRLAETGIVHFLGLVGLYDHTPPTEVRKEFQQLRADAATANDGEFQLFLDAVADRFREYINRESDPPQSPRR